MGKNTICLGCLSHNWPDPKPVVWADESGVAFCVFHAMVEEKRKALGSKEVLSEQEFNTLVYKRIEEAWQRAKQNGPESMCVLRGVIFPGDIDFSIYDQDAPLPRIDFSGARFNGSVDFTSVTFSGDALFRETQFIKQSLFLAATFDGAADFTKALFLNKSAFLGCKANKNSIKMHYLKNISMFPLFYTIKSLGKIDFTKNELDYFDFAGCEWPEELAHEKYGDGKEDNLIACEELYREMKCNSSKAHDQVMVARWHYRERVINNRRTVWLPFFEHIKSLQRLHPSLEGCLWLLLSTICLPIICVIELFSLSSLYKIVSGYGERYIRAGVWLLALALGVFALMGTVDIADSNSAAVCAILPERLYAGLQHLLFIASPQYTPAEPLWRSALLVLTRVLIPLQFTLFALAVRNRFRR